MKIINLKRKSILLSIGMFICLSTQISTVSADEMAHPDMMPSHCEHKSMPDNQLDMMLPLPPYLRDLDLTEDQKDKIFAITYAQLPKLRDMEIQKHKTITALKKLAGSSQFNDTKGEALATKLASLDKELILLHIGTDVKIRAVLTVEQKQKISTFEDDFIKAPHCHMPPY
jgi:periplasmic protein CpxP/Spy